MGVFWGPQGNCVPSGEDGFSPHSHEVHALFPERGGLWLESAPFPQERRFNEADPRGEITPSLGGDDNHFGGFLW